MRVPLKWILPFSVCTLLIALVLALYPYPPSPLEIIPRAGWGAAAPNIEADPEGWIRYNEPLSQVLDTIIVHHSALPVEYGPAEIQRMHKKDRGFSDIGYHFVIDAEGRVYEGRALEIQGAHTRGHNAGAIGIVLLGNFEEDRPGRKQLGRLRQLTEVLSKEYGITHLAGHRDFLPEKTLCPGKFLEKKLRGLASRMNLEFGTTGKRHDR